MKWALPSKFRIKRVGERIDILQSGLKAKSKMDLYERIMSHWELPCQVVIGSRPRLALGFEQQMLSTPEDYLEAMSLTDMKTYLQEDVLAKVDRSSMAVSLEAREPLLDHRLIEFALSLPACIRASSTTTKPLLRSILYKYVPKEMIERPKQGFAAPVGDWINGALKDWADALLSPQRLKSEGYLEPEAVGKMLKEHRSGKRNWQFALWNVLMFQAWLEANSLK